MFTWTPTAADSGSYTVSFQALNALSGAASTAITVTNGDRAPVVAAPDAVSGAEGETITVRVHAADPDGDAITALTADLTALPLDEDAQFAADPGDTAGTLTWTPALGDAGPYTVTFTASNALSGHAATVVTVAHVDRPPAVTAPTSASGPGGSPITIEVTASDPDGDAIDSLGATSCRTCSTRSCSWLSSRPRSKARCCGAAFFRK